MLDGRENDPAIRAALELGERVLWHSRPGAVRLVLSVAPRLARDMVFLLVIGFACYAGWRETATVPRLLLVALVLFIVWLLIRNLREATAASVSHYLITDRRIVLLTPRADPKCVVILPRAPTDVAERHRSRWIDGQPLVDRIAGGRATICIRYEHYRPRSINYPQMVYRSNVVRLYAVTDSVRAIDLIGRLGRR